MYLLQSPFDHFNCQKLILIILRRGHHVVYWMWRRGCASNELTPIKKCRNYFAWIAVRVFNQINQIFLRLNFRSGKENQLLILQNWLISAQIDFLQICINTSLYEWPDRQGPVTIWLTTCSRVFCHSLKILIPCYKRIL